MMATPAPSAMSSTELDSMMELSAVAQEAIGFADDQFMEVSSSGASLYDLALFTEPSSSAGGRLNQSGASNGSLRRMLQNTKARDESSLSPSGMSLASLGSLSRSTRRLSGLIDVDEALDDSIAWRHTGVKVEDGDGDALDVSENGAAEGKEVTSADLPGGRTRRNPAAATAAEAAAAAQAASAVAAAAAEAGVGAAAEAAADSVGSPLLNTAERRTNGEGDPVSGAAGGAGTQQSITAVEVPPAGEGMAHGGRVRELSLGVAELRQQAYHRRMACASVSSNRSVPPLPVGVDLAPPSAPFPSSTSRQPSQQQQRQQQQQQHQRQQHPGSGAAAGLDAWRPGRAQGEMMTPHLSDSLDGSSGGVGCNSSVGGGSSNGSNRGTLSKFGKKSRQRARAALVRTVQGLGHALQGTAGGANENRSLSLEGDSSVTSGSWSADSSATEAARGVTGGVGGNPDSARHSDSPETTSQPLERASGSGTAGISALSESTPTTSTPAAHAAVVAVTATRAATPPAPHGAGVVAASSQQQQQAGAAAKPGAGGGLRGKIVQVWGNRRKQEKKEPAKQARDGPQQGRDGAQTQQAAGGLGGAPGMPARSAVLQPAGGGGGGFAFLPAQGQSLEAYQEWTQSHSARAGVDSGKPVEASVTLEGSDGNGGGGGSGSHPHEEVVFPTTPLGTSTRSFDPNMSPSTGDVDGSNVSLPPLLGTQAALTSLGASFDPNRSTRSWFDMSTESTNRPSPGADAGLLWQQTHQHHQYHQHQLQRQQQLQHVLPTVPAQQGLPSETPTAARETGGAAGAATVAVSTSPGAATDSSVTAVTPTQDTVQTEAAAAAATAAAAAAAAALPATLLDEDQLVGELSDLSISSGRRRSKARLVLSSAIATDATSADTISDHGSIAGNVGNAVSVSGDSGSDGIARADTPASTCGAVAPAVPAVPRDGAHHEWEEVEIGTGGRNNPSLVPTRCFSAEVVPNVAPGDPSSWPDHGSLDRGSLGKRATTLPDDWSLAMHQQVLPWGGMGALGGTRAQQRNASRGGGGGGDGSGGAAGTGLPPMAAGPSAAPLGKGGAVPSAAAAAALSTAAAAASGAACGGGSGGGSNGGRGDMALDTVGGLGREGLRLPPTSASSTLYHRSARAQSVDVGVLQTMTRLRDPESERTGAGQQAMGWPAGWPPRQGEGFGLAGEGSTLPPVESLMSGALSPPSSMPQRSVSADTSMSESRSFRHRRSTASQGGAADCGGVGVGVDGSVFGGRGCSEGMGGRWPSDGGSSGVGGGGGSFRFDDAFHGNNGGFQSICPAPSPPLDGDDSIHARPLSGGGEGARDCTPRGSWSALHAMIPTPGVNPGGGAGPGTGAAGGSVESAAVGAAAAAVAAAGQQHSRRATIPQPRASADEEGIRRNSHAEVLGVLTSDGQGCGGGEVGGGRAGVETGRAHSGGSSSWGSAPSSFGLPSQPPLSSDSSGVQESASQEVFAKRRLNSSRVLDVFGKHKKQCLDVAAPAAPGDKPKAAAAASGTINPSNVGPAGVHAVSNSSSSSSSNGGGGGGNSSDNNNNNNNNSHNNTIPTSSNNNNGANNESNSNKDNNNNDSNGASAAFEPFGYLRERFGVNPASSAAVKAPSSGVSCKGEQGVTPSYEAPEAVKKARQAVAARRPRTKGGS